VNGCAHAAWATSSTYLAACDGREPASQSIEQPTAGSRLEFRVNRDVVVLNDLTTGNAWLVDSDLRLVDNWEEVTPPEETDELEGDEKSAQQTFEDTLAERTDVNRPPVARDDEAGVRPGRTTVLEVLENDTDPDGDVLTVSSMSEVAESQGRLELIDGGRALQFTPAEGAAGTVSFRYSVDDGRLGVSEASVERADRARARERGAHVDAVGRRERRAGPADLLQRARRLERPRRRRRVPRERLADERRLGAVQPRRLRDVRPQVGRARPQGRSPSPSPTGSSPRRARSPST
jgi:hypothetical protein